MKNLLKKMLYLMPRIIRIQIYKIYNYIFYHNLRKKKKHYGELNKDKTFYVIRPRTNGVEGLMALLLYVLKQTAYAEKKNYIPVVDMKNYRTQYSSDKLNENVWDMFFRTKNEYSLDDVYDSKNVILSGVNQALACPKYLDLDFNDNSIEKVKNLFNKYYDISKNILDFVDAESKEYDYNSLLGLYLRGTDYSVLKPAGHPVQPTIEQAIDVIEEYIKKFKIERIFLVTEDKKIYTNITKKYEEMVKVVSFDSFIEDYKGDTFISKKYLNSISDSPYERGRNYLCKLIILSKCNYLITGKTCGSWATLVLSSSIREKYIFNLGNY